MKEQPFYIGQKVVALNDHSQGAFKKGDEFTVQGLHIACCNWLVDIGIKTDLNKYNNRTLCTSCNKPYNDFDNSWWFSYTMFSPVQENFEAISFSKIMEEELASVN